MFIDDPNRRAELVASVHQPWKASVAECLARWRLLDAGVRSQSYLVVHGEAGLRHTLNGALIADLANAAD